MRLSSKILATLTSIALAATAVVGFHSTSAEAASTPGPRSKLPWVSGAYLEHNGAKVVPYEQGRGRKLDAIVVFPARNSESALLNDWWWPAVTPVTNDGGLAVITVPLWAENQNAWTNTTNLFTKLGQQIQSKGIASRTVVRVGWEMNLPGQYWNVNSGNRAQWVANFKRAVNLLRQYAPGVKIAFNPNEGPSQTNLANIGQLAIDLKDYFEYVGPDYYNWWPQADTQAQWDARYTSSYGMKYWEDWAKSNGKGFTVPEWGGAPTYNNSTSVFYTQKMVERFAALSAEGVPVLEAHFNEPADYIQDSLWNPQQMPLMAEALRAALAAQPSGGVTSTPTTVPTTVPTTTPPTTNPTTPPGCN